MGEALTSCTYDCEVYHQRLKPKRHSFRYRLFFMDLDLEELPKLSRKLWLFSHNRFNNYTFRDKDHLDVGEPDIRSNLAAWMKEQGVELAPDAKVRLLTIPRVLGYIFNPVCFYCIFSRSGEPQHVVVEVCNTFKELKPWLIEKPDSDSCFHLTAPKNFYVSPFSSLTTDFDFRVRIPAEKVEIHIDDQEAGETTLVSWIRGDRKPLSDRQLLWYSLRFPFLTVGVIFRIHWQALRLWLRKVPFFRKADNPDQQTDLYRPHSTLKSKPTENT